MGVSGNPAQALADLRDSLVAAKAANDRVAKVFDHALGELNAGFHTRYLSSVLDCGDQGVCTTAGGLDRWDIYEPLLDDQRFQAYLKEVDAHLAALPALPQGELDRRERLEAAVRRGIEHDRELEKRLAEVRRQAEQLARLDQPQS